jgi:lysophospholipase L1-like esterase
MATVLGWEELLPPTRSVSPGPHRGWLRAHRLMAAVAATAVLSAGTAAAVTAQALPAQKATATSGAPAVATVHTAGAAPASAVGAATVAQSVIVGDSHAWLWAMRVPTIPDLGVPGAVTAGIALQIPEALAMRPKYVVISAGTNDLNEGRSPAEVLASLQAMVAEVEAGGATPILLLLPSYGATMSTAIWTETQILPADAPAIAPLPGAGEVPAVNAGITAMGVLTLQAPAGQTIDGIHLNAAGYAAITEQLAKIIN